MNATHPENPPAPELIRSGTLFPADYDDYPSATRFWVFAPGTTIERAIEIIENMGFDTDGHRPCADYSPTGQWFTYGIQHHTFKSGRLIVTQHGALDI